MFNFFYDKNAKKNIKYDNKFEQIFSIKKISQIGWGQKTYKVITIFGFKFLYFDFSQYKTLKNNYKKIVKRLKSSDKINVVFVVSDALKWKMQPLYDLMSESSLYTPTIAIAIADYQMRLSKGEKEEILNNNYKYFKDKGMNCFLAYGTEQDEPINMKEYKPDIIFYQQPDILAQNLHPYTVSEYALTCYLPYFVPSYGIINIDCNDFHSHLFRYYVLNKESEKIYKKYMKPINYNIYATGHTVFDEISKRKSTLNNNDSFVIYAPHCAIKHPKIRPNENYSTFLYTGVPILNYAKEHPEINWVFRPHPELKNVLWTIGWPPKMIDDYYEEWEKLSNYSNVDGDLIDLFLNSKALITDCDFLLTEYYGTGKPIIHLTSPDCKVWPSSISAEIFKSFYTVNNKYDLFKYINDVIIKGNDRKIKERENILLKYNMANTDAAKNILEELSTTIKGKNYKY